MAHLAVPEQIAYSRWPTGGPMAKSKAVDDGKTQHQRFVEAAREHGTDESEDTFKRALRKVATAPVTKKDGSRKPNR